MSDGRATTADGPRDWVAYYQSTAERPPRRTTLVALASLEGDSGLRSLPAVDLGCGGGRDAALAVD